MALLNVSAHNQIVMLHLKCQSDTTLWQLTINCTQFNHKKMKDKLHYFHFSSLFYCTLFQQSF